MLTHEERRIPRRLMLQSIDRIQTQIRAKAKQEQICHDISKNPAEILHHALATFRRFHRTHVLTPRGEDIEVGTKLALYYSNRLHGYGFSAMGEST